MNLSELGRKYGVNGTCANIIVKEFLIGNDIDLNQFNNLYIKDGRARRAKVKFGGIIIDYIILYNA